MAIKLLKFGEDAVGQQRTLRIVVTSFLGFVVGGLALVALATSVVDPVVALIVTLATLVLALLGFRIKGSED